jgi:hypothetical protein
MKILLFYTSHRQVKEFDYLNRFMKKLSLKEMSDVFIYCNCPHVSEEVGRYYKDFPQKNKHLYVTTFNCGYNMGGVEACSRAYDMGVFKDYDYVIHLHPDVFITDDKELLQVLNDNLENDTIFFITKSVPNHTFFSFDFFIFKPKLLTENIFKDNIYNWNDCPEFYLYTVITNHDVKYTFINRFKGDGCYPRRISEHLQIWHEHDLSLVENYFNNRNVNWINDKDAMLNMIQNIPNVNIYPLTYVFETLKLQHKENTLWLEFGVGDGNSINYISKFTSDKIYGFDSFEGLPDVWRHGFDKGRFNRDGIPPIVNENVVLIKGLFDAVLSDFLNRQQQKKISFIHIDCDIYSSTKYVLDTVAPFMDTDCIIVFDELINYYGFDGDTGELKAFYEFTKENRVDYTWVAVMIHSVNK